MEQLCPKEVKWVDRKRTIIKKKDVKREEYERRRNR